MTLPAASTSADHSPPGSTERTRIRRLPELACADRQVAYSILDAGRIAHVSTIDGDGQPYVLPIAYARRGDAVLFHGSTGSRLFRALADGQATCLTVTILDALVVARSAFESSMNYRCVMVLGRATRLVDADELDGLRTLTDHLLPGRWAQCRHPSPKERAATMVLSMALAECSVKVRTGDPDDAETDVTHPRYGRIWAGQVPIREHHGDPVRATNCPIDVAVPDYVLAWSQSPLVDTPVPASS